jgi:hypothetical protein
MITLRNQYGALDLSVVDPAEVAKLDDNQQKLLASLISAMQDREAAQDRYAKAVKAVHDATTDQHDALEAHTAANPPLTPQQAQQAAIAAYNSSH